MTPPVVDFEVGLSHVPPPAGAGWLQCRLLRLGTLSREGWKPEPPRGSLTSHSEENPVKFRFRVITPRALLES